MSNRIESAADVSGVLPTMPPRWVFACFNPIARFLLGAGVPLASNGLIQWPPIGVSSSFTPLR